MNRIAYFMTNRVGITVIALSVLYAVAAMFVPARLLIEIGDAYAISMSAAAFWVYGQTLIGRTRRAPDYIDLLILGVFGGWLTNCLDRSMRLIARVFDFTLINSPMIGYFLMLLTFFAAIHVLVKGATSDKPIKTRYTEGFYVVVWALIVGTLFSIGLILFHVYQGDVPIFVPPDVK